MNRATGYRVTGLRGVRVPTLFRSLCLPGLLVCLTAAAANPGGPVDVIFDTDMGNDVDDVLALGLLHALESRGECRLLAVTITKDEPLAAAFTDAVNTFYGRPDIPIGLVRDGVTPGPGKFLGLATIRDGDTLRYPHDLDGAAAADAVRLLRETLAGRPDGSVVIVQVGFSTNLARLLDTPADDVSPLSGRDLVTAKVRLLSVMGGAFAPIDGKRHGEYNLVKDIAAAQKLAAEWPTPIIWSGYEIGLAMKYPPQSIRRDYRWAAHHPLAESYERYQPPPHARPTWDLTSVLAVVRPDRGYFGLSAPGRVVVEDDGRVRFEPDPAGPHRHLVADAAQAARCIEAFANLCSQPVDCAANREQTP
jgi:inosine-uridine nucleoside N-ribohydrolase